MLTLPIKKKYFDMILKGEKKEEYRDMKKYYESRFKTVFGVLAVEGRRFSEPQQIMLKNGYRKDSPALIVTCTLNIGEGRPEWGAERMKQYYILEILKVEKPEKDL